MACKETCGAVPVLGQSLWCSPCEEQKLKLFLPELATVPLSEDAGGSSHPVLPSILNSNGHSAVLLLGTSLDTPQPSEAIQAMVAEAVREKDEELLQQAHLPRMFTHVLSLLAVVVAVAVAVNMSL